jgi:hypothetical protein
MKCDKLRNFFFIFLVFSLSNSARGNLVSSFDASFGFTSMNLSTNGYSKSLSGVSLIETNYLLWLNSISGAVVISFSELLQGEGKILPMTQLGFGYRYYPIGFNGARSILDQGVVGRIWKSTPFLGLNINLVNISVDAFNASLIAIAPRFGVELPLTTSLFAQASLVFNSASSTGAKETQVTYEGFSALLGVVFTDF